MATILAVLEQRGGDLKRVSLEALSAARTCAGDDGAVHALVLGPPGVDVATVGAYGADTVFSAADESLALYQPDPYAAAVLGQCAVNGYDAVVLVATAMGKDLGPRIAAGLKCPYAADVTAIEAGGELILTRPVYSGKALYRLRVTATPCVISARPNVFAPSEFGRAGSEQSVAVSDAPRRVTTVSIKQPERAALDVAEASIVVSGGRGLKEPEHFHLVEELADALGGAVGASRAVVDAGWRPHSEQVGQTGKTVSPNLYVAVGISGAVQHLAGMRTASVIVAINRDKDAPIFKVADYGVVGDLFEIVPRLTEEINKIRGS